MAWTDAIEPKRYPVEFRDNVVRDACGSCNDKEVRAYTDRNFGLEQREAAVHHKDGAGHEA